MEFSVVSRAKRGIKKEERRERKEGRKKGNSFRHRYTWGEGIKKADQVFSFNRKGVERGVGRLER